MYKSMIRNGIRSGALLVCFLLAAASAKCLEKSIELGKEHLWGDMQSLDGVTRVDGKWGFKDLALSYGEYAPDGSTELLLHFDNESPPEPERAYRFIDSAPRIENKVFALGGGSALFNGERSGVSLEAPPGALFAPGAVWGDVSIEFWLYPATLSDGETVLSWTGAARAGEPGSSQLAAQSMRCYIKERKLVWDFQDFFALPTGSWLPVTFSGTRKLIPRAWHHHLLRFNARSGLLEYLIDGVPEAIAHVTDNGRESGSIAVPRLGLQEAGPLVLGAGFTGFLDELRVSRRVVDDPMIQRFAGKTGTATSSIIDLGFTATRISRIEATYTTPGDSGVEFYYQVSDVWRNPRLLKTDTDWVPFTPPGDFKETLKGRYLQLMVVLVPGRDAKPYPEGLQPPRRLRAQRTAVAARRPSCRAGQRQGDLELANRERAGRQGLHGLLRDVAAQLPGNRRGARGFAGGRRGEDEHRDRRAHQRQPVLLQRCGIR